MTKSDDRLNEAGAWNAVIVERSPDVQALMIGQLKARGFQIAATLERPNHAAVEVRTHKANLLILEVNKSAESVLKSIEDLTGDSRNLRVIVTAPAAEPDLILRVLRAGATEFLVQPVSPEEFARALDRVVRSFAPRRDANGQIFAVYSPKGGLGSTSVAVNLAFTLAREHPRQRVALADTVVSGGDVKVFLDMIPQYTITDLLGKGDSIDTQLLETVLYKHPGGVWVLPEPGQEEDADAITGEQMAEVIRRLGGGFDFVVVDCEHQLTERTLAILDTADTIVLVTVLSVPAIRQLQRTLDVFERLGYPEHKIHLVVNRHQTSDVLRVRDVEKSLERRVLWRLPNDYKVAIDAITRGRPLVSGAPRSKLSRSFQGLAAALNSAEPERAPSMAAKMRNVFTKSKKR